MKCLVILALPIVLASCATTQPLPQPTSAAIPINSVSTLEELAHERGQIIVGPQRHVKAVRALLLNRPSNPDDYAIVHGNQLMDRIVSVEFDRLSYKFAPPETGPVTFQLRSLMAAADYIEVRGRSSDPTIAEKRAIAAKMYLVDRGMPADKIQVTFSTSDPIRSVLNDKGRASNRRVDIEFFITEPFDKLTRNSCNISDKTNTTCGALPK